MINLSDVVNDPQLAQAFQIERLSPGSFVNEGVWQEGSPTVLERYGVITPSKPNDVLTLVPEGERTGEMITVYCSVEILMSNGSDQQSDRIIWLGKRYKVVYSKPWQQFGYYFVIASYQAEDL